MRRTTSAALVALAAAGLVLAACGDDPPSFSCVANLATDCQPLVDPPTFQAIYDGTLHPTCASGRGTCHTADAAKGGLVFEDPDQSYKLLLGLGTGTHARVVPNDPACSLIVERLEATTSTTRMPPGPTPLPAAERCTIVQWILQGAPR